MEIQIKSKDIPFGYQLCFNEECPLRNKCLHYQAYLLKGEDRLGENKLTPRQQKEIMAILTKFGSTDGLAFDHYETVGDFD